MQCAIEFRIAHGTRGDQSAERLGGKRVSGVTYTNNAQRRRNSSSPLGSSCSAPMRSQRGTDAAVGIGKPYDPIAQTGVVGKNYCYQTALVRHYFETSISSVHVDRGLSMGADDSIPISNRPRQVRLCRRLQLKPAVERMAPHRLPPLPAGTPPWARRGRRPLRSGTTCHEHQYERQRDGQRYNCYDLDPTYRNAFGQPLMP